MLPKNRIRAAGNRPAAPPTRPRSLLRSGHDRCSRVAPASGVPIPSSSPPGARQQVLAVQDRLLRQSVPRLTATADQTSQIADTSLVTPVYWCGVANSQAGHGGRCRGRQRPPGRARHHGAWASDKNCRAWAAARVKGTQGMRSWSKTNLTTRTGGNGGGPDETAPAPELVAAADPDHNGTAADPDHNGRSHGTARSGAGNQSRPTGRRSRRSLKNWRV